MNGDGQAPSSCGSYDETRDFQDRVAVQVLVYRVDDQRFGLVLNEVERVIRAVALTPVQDSSGNILGVVNVQGRLIPVLNLRKILQKPRRGLLLSDVLVLARFGGRFGALPVDSVSGVLDCSTDAIISSDEITSGIENLSRVIKLPDGLVLINDFAGFLPQEEGGAYGIQEGS